MSESKHTPGPWFVGAQNDALYILDRRPAHGNDYPNHEADVACIAKVYDDVRGVETSGRDNAALIASAPDLAAEVERLRVEREDDEATRAMMADILSRTAVALRGPEPEGTRYGWADLPERVAAAVAAIDVMQKAAALNGAELERLRADLAAMTADRDSWADQADQRVADWDDEQRRCAGALEALGAERRKVEALEAELAMRRKSGSAVDRLHNLCEGIAADADGSEWSREEWERIDAENAELRRKVADAPPVALLWKVRQALALACAICDAVPTRDPGHLGKLVNAQDDGTHGYREIHEAEAALVQYLTTPVSAAIDAALADSQKGGE